MERPVTPTGIRQGAKAREDRHGVLVMAVVHVEKSAVIAAPPLLRRIHTAQLDQRRALFAERPAAEGQAPA